MPIYEYECANCKFYVESLQKISEPPLKKCPSCKKQTMKRLVSAPVFRLKGGGWYETDFKSDQEGKRNLAGGEEAGEAKPEAATDKDQGKDKDAKPAESVKESDKKPAAEPKKSVSRKPAPRPAKSGSKAKAKAKPAKRAAKRRR
jgi:putative FmdB family regulatory protein